MRSLKKIIATLVIVFGSLSSIAYAGDAALSSSQKDEVIKLIRETIVKNPEIIVEALQVLELKQKAASQQREEDTLVTRHYELFNHTDDPVGGNINGDVNFVEFYDYRCGYCKKVHDTVMKLLKDDGNLRYIYKEFPILGPESIFAAKASLAAQEQGKFIEFSDLLMRNRGSFSEGKIYQLAQSIGLDSERLKQDIKRFGEKYEQIFQRNYSLAKDLNITGTPGFIIGKTIIRGAADYDTLKKAVDNARKSSKK